MKKFRKNLFSAAIVSMAVFMAFQAVSLKTSFQIGSVPEQDATVTKAAARAETNEPMAIIQQPSKIVAASNTDSKINGAPVVSVKDSKVVEESLPVEQTSAIKENSTVSASVAVSPAKTVTVASGGQQIIPGVLYDPENEILYGPDGRGLLYIGFDYDMKQKLFYSSINPWQKNFGYSKLYDDFAPITNILFETRIITFSYANRDWMIQIWKGIYGITSGAEVGIYNKDPNSSSLLYNCASENDYLLMNLELFKDGQPYFSREEQMHWWLTGFVLGDIVSPKDLTLKSTITFKDQEMTEAFIGALNSQENLKDIYYSVDGLKVSLDW